MYRKKTKLGTVKYNTGEYNGIPYDSGEELAFLQWCYELKEVGYIKDVRRGESYLLSNSLKRDYVIQLKTKSKPATQLIMHGHSYNPDFEVDWDFPKMWKDKVAIAQYMWAQIELIAPFVCYDPKNGLNARAVIEIKPVWDSNSMERLFKLNQKWMWDKLGIYVNLIKPVQLFQKTFTPKEYLKTPTGKPKKISWKPRTLEEYLKTK